MASRAKLHKAAADVLASVIEIDETIATSAPVLTGPSPWFRLLVLSLPLVNQSRWIAVTDRRVIFLSINQFTGRMRFHHSDDLAGVSLFGRRDGPLWSVARYRKPSGGVVRLNIHRRYRRELDALSKAIRTGSRT